MDLYEGVNIMLQAIGEVPITDNTQALEAPATSDVGIARDTLLEMSKSIQSTGYWFNKEDNYPLVPNTEGYIPISHTVLDLYSTSGNYIIKDHKLYNLDTKSFKFENSVTVTIVFLLQFDDLQPIPADAIVREATKAFYNNVLGDTQELRILEANAERARIQLQKKQAKHRGTNLIRGSRIVNRGQNPTGVS